MQFSIKATAAERLKTGCLVVPVWAGGALGVQGRAVDAASSCVLAQLAKRDLEERAGSLLAIPHLAGVAAERVLLVSLGKRDEASDKSLRSALAAVGRWLANARVCSSFEKIGAPCEFSDVLMSSGQPVSSPTSSSRRWRNASSEPATVWSRALSS